MKNLFSRRIRKAFIISMITLTLCSAASLLTLNEAREKEDWVQHTYLVIERLEFLLSVLKDAETGTRGFVITRQPETLAPYNNAQSAALKVHKEIELLTRDNGSQQATLQSLRNNIHSQFKILAFYIIETKAGRMVTPDKIEQGKQVMDEARAMVKLMKDREHTLLQNRNNEWHKLYVFIFIFIIALSLCGVASAIYFCQKLLRNYFDKVRYRRKFQQQGIIVGNRIRVLQSLTAQIAAGNYGIEITGHEKDALGILAEDINRMTISLDRSFKQLNETMNRKDEFINITAHEFRTPLTSIQTTLQLLGRLKIDKDEFNRLVPFIQKANSQVKRLTTMLKDLLDVSRLNRNELTFSKSHFLLRSALDESIQEVKDGKADHQIELNMTEDVEVNADRPKIIQVLTNLLSNSIKYSYPGSTIKVNVVALETDVRIEIEDEGKGIPADKIQFVFDRYFRVEQTSQNYNGLGLGLYISKKIIKKHNGSIGVNSVVNKGTTFWFTLPISGNTAG